MRHARTGFWGVKLSHITVKRGRKSFSHHNGSDCCTFCKTEKETHEKLKLGKILMQAKLKKSLTVDEYLQILIERSEQK